MLTNPKDEELISRLKLEDNNAFLEIYRKYFYSAKAYILQNKGNLSDAEDTFQEALFVLVKNLRKNDFEIKVSLPSYVQSIVRFTWLNKLRSKKEFANDTLPELMEDNIEFLDDLIVRNANHDLIEKVLTQDLKSDCKELLHSFYYLKENLSTIAMKMNLSESFIKVKKHRCMEYLANAFTKHPDYKNVNN